MKKITYQEKIASNLPPDVEAMLKKRQLSEMRQFEQEQIEAEKAAQASLARMQLREKLGLAIARFCKVDDLLLEMKTFH